MNGIGRYNSECNICSEDFSDQRPATDLTCRHGYHWECIKRWYDQKLSEHLELFRRVLSNPLARIPRLVFKCPFCQYDCTFDPRFKRITDRAFLASYKILLEVNLHVDEIIYPTLDRMIQQEVDQDILLSLFNTAIDKEHWATALTIYRRRTFTPEINEEVLITALRAEQFALARIAVEKPLPEGMDHQILREALRLAINAQDEIVAQALIDFKPLSSKDLNDFFMIAVDAENNFIVEYLLTLGPVSERSMRWALRRAEQDDNDDLVAILEGVQVMEPEERD